MKHAPETPHRQAGPKVLRAGIVAGALLALATLSYVFMPPGPPDRRAQRAAGLLNSRIDDLSPLSGMAFSIDGVQIRRLEGLAVVTFTFDVFDERQELRPEARQRLLQFAAGMRPIARRVALDVAGYAPENTRPAEAYAIGLARATGVARCMVEAAGIPPAAVSARSLGATIVAGASERPHAVVIAITPLHEVAQLLASRRDARL